MKHKYQLPQFVKTLLSIELKIRNAILSLKYICPSSNDENVVDNKVREKERERYSERERERNRER